MPRRASAAAFAALTLGLAGLTAARAQPPAPQPPAAPTALERVIYRDRTAEGRVTTDSGEVKESPRGLELTVNKQVKLIAPGDVLRHDPNALPGLAVGDLQAARAAEDARDSAKARQIYADLAKKAGPGAPERTKRILSYREAYHTVKLADQKSEPEFAPRAREAAAKLAATIPAVKKSWEVVPACRTLARLHAELGEYPKAAEAFQNLAATTDLPAELRLQALLNAAAMLVRAKQLPAAAALVDQVEKDRDFASSGSRDAVAVLRAAPDAAKLQAATDAAQDPAAKAFGYALAGDAHLAAGRTRDAMWAYLWVDTVFNADHEEQILAVRQLQTLFEKQGDKDRAEQFRDKLVRLR